MQKHEKCVRRFMVIIVARNRIGYGQDKIKIELYSLRSPDLLCQE